jgi:MFS family permease
VGGNGIVEMGTFVAILLGTMLGGALIAIPGVGAHYVAAVSMVLAILGRLAAGFVPASPPPAPDLVINWNPVSETLANLRHAHGNRTVFLSLLGISWMWFFGSVFLTTFAGFAKENLGGDQNVVTLLLAVFSVGIGAGSLLCERLSGHKVEIGLVPFGSIGMTVFAIDLWLACQDLAPHALLGPAAFLADRDHWRVMVDLLLLAMFAGFYSVPLYALIQSRCEASHRARVIAANNILNALFMVVASVMAAGMLQAGLSLPQLYLVLGLLNAAVAVYIYLLVPEFLMRFIVWMLIHTVYRLDKRGVEHLPDHGPALIVCNHVSFVDALVIAAACPRPIRFVMDHNIFKMPIISFVFRTGRAIPIASAPRESQDDGARF